MKEKEDHLLCHEIEREEIKNDIIINVSPNGEIEQNSQNKYSKFFNNVHAFDYYPISVIKDINKLVEDKKRCIICLENFKNGDESIILPCVHIFHSKCIRRWVERKRTCPFCNYKINIPRLIKKFTPLFKNNTEDKKSNSKNILKSYLNVLEYRVHLTDDQNEIRNEAQEILTFGRIDYEETSQNYENENSYNSSSNPYNSNSYNSSINSIDYSSSYYNSNANSILNSNSNQNSYNSNSYNSNLYNSYTNSVVTSNSNTNSVTPSNSSTNSYNSKLHINQVNDSLFGYIKNNNSIKNNERYKNSLNNSKKDIDKFKNNQNKEESNYSNKNFKSNEEEDEKEENEDKEDEVDDKEDEEDGNEKKNVERNELKKNIKKYENISIDNNIEILSILNPKRNSLTYTTKNNANKNIHRASILSSKVNNQNLKYNYLNNLTLEEKIKYRRRSNSTEIIDINSILSKEVLVKNKNTEILLYKLKNLNMSL